MIRNVTRHAPKPALRSRTLAAGVLALACLAGDPAPAIGQGTNPVYLDIAPRAVDTLASLDALIASGNWNEAVRAIQRLLDEHHGTVITSEAIERGPAAEEPAEDLGPGVAIALGGAGDLARPLRAVVHEKLLSNPELLDRYRQTFNVRAQRELETDGPERVERSLLLTEPGFEAALRLAQRRLESARFHSARLTLEQLENHPDRSRPEAARDLAQLGLSVLAYLPEGDPFAAITERWCTGAGIGFTDPQRAPAPPAALIDPRDPFVAHGQIDLADIPPAPLESLSLDDEAGAQAAGAIRGREVSPGRPRVMPVLVGDTVLVNDGRSVRSLDRFTLAENWSAAAIDEESDDANQPQFRGQARRYVRLAERPETLAVAGDTVIVAAVGDGEVSGSPLVQGLALSDGAVRWVTDVSALDTRLEEAVVHGPVTVCEGLAIVPVRRFVQTRRIMSAYLVAIEASTGEHRWTAPLGSVGSLPYQQGRPAASYTTAHRGILYRTDRLGVVAAIEAPTGRPVWVRREATVARGRGSDEPWASGGPHIVGDRLLTLDPDRTRLLWIDLASGSVMGARSTTELGPPDYTVVVGDYLAAIGSTRVLFVPTGDPMTADPAATRFFREAQPFGRAVAVAGKLLLPTTRGATLIDPASPTETVALDLDASGNLLPAPAQLLVASGSRLHSFLAWESAIEVLDARIEESPRDFTPWLTKARLAYRSDRPELILDSVDGALRAAGRPGWTGARNDAVGQVFATISSVVAASHNDVPVANLDTPRIDRPELVAGLIQRMLRAAQNPKERAASLLALGRQAERGGRSSEAVDAYQEILTDVDLAGAMWSGSGPAVRAAAEAGQRIERLVSTFGAGVYAAYDAEAQLEQDLLPPGASPEDYEKLAARFPASALTNAWWLRAGEQWAAIDRPHEAVRALRRAIDSAALDAKAGRPLPGEQLGETYGLLLTTLLEAQRPHDAARVLTEQTIADGRILPMVNGQPVALAALRSAIDQQLEERRRLPSVGAEITGDPAWLDGWRALNALTMLGSSSPPGSVVMWQRDQGLVAMWKTAEGGGIEPVWSRRVGADLRPVLVRHDAGSVFLMHRSEGAVTLDRIDADSGRLDWSVASVTDAMPADAAIDRAVRTREGAVDVDTLEGSRPADDLLTLMDGQTIVVMERTGRVAAFDLLSGEVLWADTLSVRVVYDADLNNGLLAVCGIDGFGFDVAEGEPVSLAVVIDARTGAAVRSIESADDPLRWVRLGPDTSVILGLDGGLRSVGALRGETRWELSPNVLGLSRHAWVIGDKLYVLARGSEFVIVDARKGEFAPGPIRADGRVGPRRTIRVAPIGEPGVDDVVFTSRRGVLIVSAEGAIQGIDALDGAIGLTPPAIGRPLIVALDAIGRAAPEGFSDHDLYLFTTTSGKLHSSPVPIRLPAVPESVRLLDGRILVTTEFGTAVLDAPSDGALEL